MIRPQTFVKAWMECETIEAVAKRLNVSKTTVSAKATILRSKGVKLPRKHPAPASINVDELNAIIAKYKVGQ